MRHNKLLRKQVISVLMASILALPLSLGLTKPTVAEAGIADIVGAVVAGSQARSQLNAVIEKYNNTEEGRQEFFQNMQKEYGVCNDYAKNAQLNRIMTNLSSGIAAVDPSIKNKPYNYFINNDDSFNAFCTLGHNLSVNKGLYNVLTNEDEIAVVIGHELGHGQKDHPAQGARKSLNASIIGAAVGNQAASVMAKLYTNRNITKPMEREADALAFDYIIHTNYNPGATAAVWQRVLDLTQSQPSAMQQFISDHPADDDRRDAYVKRLNQYSNGHVMAKDATVTVNSKTFVKPAATGNMSAAERSYFVMGNLAAAYHNGQNKYNATASGNTVKLGNQPIITCTANDESASTLAERLNKIK